MTALADRLVRTGPVTMAEHRVVQLERLAQAALSDGTAGHVLALALDAWVHPDLHGEAREHAWATYLDAIALRDDLAGGGASWERYDDTLPGPGRQSAAIALATADADDLLFPLVHGPGRACAMCTATRPVARRQHAAWCSHSQVVRA